MHVLDPCIIAELVAGPAVSLKRLACDEDMARLGRVTQNTAARLI
jgi:hypothetical protein